MLCVSPYEGEEGLHIFSSTRVGYLPLNSSISSTKIFWLLIFFLLLTFSYLLIHMILLSVSWERMERWWQAAETVLKYSRDVCGGREKCFTVCWVYYYFTTSLTLPPSLPISSAVRSDEKATEFSVQFSQLFPLSPHIHTHHTIQQKPSTIQLTFCRSFVHCVNTHRTAKEVWSEVYFIFKLNYTFNGSCHWFDFTQHQLITS